MSADPHSPPAPGTATSLPEPASGAPVDPFPPEAEEERRRKIAEAAYRRAESKGFPGDSHQADWLDAERELFPSPVRPENI